MSTIVIDAKLKEKLLALGSVAELRDENGVKFGLFVATGETADYDEEIGISEAELDRRISAECKTFTTDEVLKHLRGLNERR